MSKNKHVTNICRLHHNIWIEPFKKRGNFNALNVFTIPFKNNNDNDFNYGKKLYSLLRTLHLFKKTYFLNKYQYKLY